MILPELALLHRHGRASAQARQMKDWSPPPNAIKGFLSTNETFDGVRNTT